MGLVVLKEVGWAKGGWEGGRAAHWHHLVKAKLGAVHMLRQPPEGGGEVSQKLTIADEGGRGGPGTPDFG